MAYENIIVETRDHVGLITLNRAKARDGGAMWDPEWCWIPRATSSPRKA